MVDSGDFGLWRWLEGVAVGELSDVAALKIDDSAVESGEAVVALGGTVENGFVRLQLVGAVSQPHGVDVSGNDKGQLIIEIFSIP